MPDSRMSVTPEAVQAALATAVAGAFLLGTAVRTTDSLKLGATIRRPPAAWTSRTCSGFNTVPAPTTNGPLHD